LKGSKTFSLVDHIEGLSGNLILKKALFTHYNGPVVKKISKLGIEKIDGELLLKGKTIYCDDTLIIQPEDGNEKFQIVYTH